MKKTKLLDCTIRDGGYYTDWDFDNDVIDTYLKLIKLLPIEYIEIGYKSKQLSEYCGEYHYLSDARIFEIYDIIQNNNKIALMIDVKNHDHNDVRNLVKNIKNQVKLIRLAVDPDKLEKISPIIDLLKENEFEIAVNLMYLSKLNIDNQFVDTINSFSQNINYLYLVDSFGSMYPEDIKRKFSTLNNKINCEIGFHGHNNLELALINSLTAAEYGASIIDSTIKGMGRGAGNLKTELMLVHNNAYDDMPVDFHALSEILHTFEKLEDYYKWGTSLTYMVSGIYSLPQKEVMELITKKRYGINAIVQYLQNVKDNVLDNKNFKKYSTYVTKNKKPIFIIGGGESIEKHKKKIEEILEQNQNSLIIHSSTRNLKSLLNLNVGQGLCLSGEEGYKLNLMLEDIDITNIDFFLLPSYPRKLGTVVPNFASSKTYELDNSPNIEDNLKDSPLCIAIECAKLFSDEIYLLGFDGYKDHDIESNSLMAENQNIIDHYIQLNMKLISLTPTVYKNLNIKSLYSF